MQFNLFALVLALFASITVATETVTVTVCAPSYLQTGGYAQPTVPIVAPAPSSPVYGNAPQYGNSPYSDVPQVAPSGTYLNTPTPSTVPFSGTASSIRSPAILAVVASIVTMMFY